MEEHNKTNENEANHLIDLNGQSCALEKQEQRNNTEDTKGKPKSCYGNPTNNTLSFSEENEPVTKFNVDEKYHKKTNEHNTKRFPVNGLDENFKTLKDALIHFNLYPCLELLDISLEDVRRRKITENEHKECFKKIDKKIMKISLNYHPDRVQRREGTENEIEAAQKLQATLNAIRAVLNYLNAAFLEDIRVDHKFQFYSKFNIRSLSNEKEVKCHIYEIKFKLCLVSKIKQNNIILHIQKFLIESKNCVSHYIQGKKKEFKKSCVIVLLQLSHCIEDFKELCIELEEIEKECKKEKNEHMHFCIQSMLQESKRDLKLLNLLEKSAKSSMDDYFDFFSTGEFIDHYFVLPFVWYINVIGMCKVMSKRTKFWDVLKFRNSQNPNFNKFPELKDLYHLTAYYCGERRYEKQVKYILRDELFCWDWSNRERFKTQIELEFRKILIDINEKMAIRFNVNHYTEVMTADIHEIENAKSTSMMHEFEEQKRDLSEGIKTLRKKTKQIEVKYDEAMQVSKDLNSKIEETLEANSKMFVTFAANKSKIEEFLKVIQNS